MRGTDYFFNMKKNLTRRPLLLWTWRRSSGDPINQQGFNSKIFQKDSTSPIFPSVYQPVAMVTQLSPNRQMDIPLEDVRRNFSLLALPITVVYICHRMDTRVQRSSLLGRQKRKLPQLNLQQQQQQETLDWKRNLGGG